MKTKLVLFGMLFFAFMSCKKGDTGPQGTPGPQGPAFSLKEGGSIQGNVTGIRSDGTPFNISFNYKYYYGPDNIYNFGSGSYGFELYRYAGSDPITQGSCDLTFDLPSLSSNIPTNAQFQGDFYNSIGNNQTFRLEIYPFSSTPFIISNFSYNSSSHVAQGDFAINLTAGDNSTGNPATLTGSFHSNAMTEYVSRIGN